MSDKEPPKKAYGYSGETRTPLPFLQRIQESLSAHAQVAVAVIDHTPSDDDA
jgi:hypothetical protein